MNNFNVVGVTDAVDATVSVAPGTAAAAVIPSIAFKFFVGFQAKKSPENGNTFQ